MVSGKQSRVNMVEVSSIRVHQNKRIMKSANVERRPGGNTPYIGTKANNKGTDRGTSYHIISYHTISYHIISYHIISYHIISYHIISYHIISYHVISHHITLHYIISHYIISNQIRSIPILSYRVTSYIIIWHHISILYLPIHIPLCVAHTLPVCYKSCIIHSNFSEQIHVSLGRTRDL